MTKRSLLIRLALPAAVLGVLTGCSPNPSTAVELGGVRMSESTVGSYTKGCMQVLDTMGVASRFTEGDVRRNVVSWSASGLIADQLAESYGITIKDSDKRQVLASLQNGPEFAANQVCGEALDGRLKLLALALEHDSAQVSRDAAAAPVVVNPRYGTWSGTDQLVTGTGSLSSPGSSGS